MSYLWFWLMKSVAEFLFGIFLLLIVGFLIGWSEWKDEKAKRERDKS